jgi:hypothetical protein
VCRVPAESPISANRDSYVGDQAHKPAETIRAASLTPSVPAVAARCAPRGRIRHHPKRPDRWCHNAGSRRRRRSRMRVSFRSRREAIPVVSRHRHQNHDRCAGISSPLQHVGDWRDEAPTSARRPRGWRAGTPLRFAGAARRPPTRPKPFVGCRGESEPGERMPQSFGVPPIVFRTDRANPAVGRRSAACPEPVIRPDGCHGARRIRLSCSMIEGCTKPPFNARVFGRARFERFGSTAATICEVHTNRSVIDGALDRQDLLCPDVNSRANESVHVRTPTVA